MYYLIESRMESIKKGQRCASCAAIRYFSEYKYSETTGYLAQQKTVNTLCTTCQELDAPLVIGQSVKVDIPRFQHMTFVYNGSNGTYGPPKHLVSVIVKQAPLRNIFKQDEDYYGYHEEEIFFSFPYEVLSLVEPSNKEYRHLLQKE